MMIAMQNVSYDTAQRRILHNITLRLWKGKLIALVGPNGAGKSTLLRLLSGEYVPSEGWVKLHDKPLAAYSNLELARQRAVMPQDISLTFAYTAHDVVAMGRYPYEGEQRLNDDALIRQCMEQTDTWHLAQRLYPTLSGGEQARVTLARVLAQQTPVVLLDEPTASLDPHHQHRVLSVARSIVRRGGVVLTILHDLNLASQYADYIVMLAAGRVRAYGKPQDVLTCEKLSSIFQTDFHVMHHPKYASPFVFSLPLCE